MPKRLLLVKKARSIQGEETCICVCKCMDRLKELVMQKDHRLSKRMLSVLLIIFMVVVSTVICVNTSQLRMTSASEAETEVELTEPEQVPPVEDQIAKHTQPVVEVEEVEAPLTQTTLDTGYSIAYFVGIVVLAIVICLIANYRKKHHKTSISVRRKCSEHDEDSQIGWMD